ncbi:hypothetical protein Tsubulata_025689 [Turnera subulata]|uniref:DUF4283 domain-containing protein n=1 Tax=Turnera subulata TaxID=218843 RepID=A0A9Q0G0F7_9ROSI|nr:hypothetical protein Tsubulata_025689 [Turnera subulata]
MVPGYLLDDTGLIREKPSLVMDLGKIQLPNPKSASSKKLKGKSVASSVQFPVAFASTASIPQDNSLPSSSKTDVHTVTLNEQVNALSDPVPVNAHPLDSSTAASSWAQVACAPSVTHPKLKFVQPIFSGENNLLSIPSELLEIGRKKYSKCLLGQFVGTAPKLGLIHSISNRLWGRDGAVSVSLYKEGLFLFQFPDDAAYSRALTRGPWHVGGIPLMLWPWSSSSKKMDFSNALFPVWVKLQNVPMELLTNEGLSYISSAIGTPLHADQDCSKIFKSDCVNVCVNVDFSKPLMNELKLDINGETCIIDVAYSWKPSHCELCNSWGHHALACSEKKSEKI